MTTWSFCIWLLLYGYCYTDESASWVKRTTGPKLGINAKVKWGGDIPEPPDDSDKDDASKKDKEKKPSLEKLEKDEKSDEIVPESAKKAEEKKDDSEIFVDILLKKPD